MHKVLKKLSCLAFLICISFFWLSSSNLRISVVGGTWDIVPEDLKRFSVANGAVLFESGWCNNFNYFGNLYPVQTKDHLGRTVIGYDPVKTDNVTKLVQTLFHRISPSFTDFSTTDLIKIQDPVTIAQLAALILVGLDTLVDGVGKIQTHYESLKLEIEKLKESPDAELKKDRKALKELDNLRKAVEKAESTGNFGAVIETGLKSLKHKKSRLSSYAAELNKTFDVYLKAQPNLQANQANLNVWLGPVTQLFKLPELKISPYKFACIVAGALQECQPYAAAPYPENLVYSIFLAFLWKTLEKVCKTDIEQNRFALQIYYRELSKLTGRNMELSDDTMLPEKINSSQAREKLIESLENTDEKPLALDSFLYYVLASRRYPPAESYALVHYKPFETDTRIVAFPDCMETSLANFFRRLSYDPLTATYSITTLETNLGITLTALARERLDLFFKNILDHTVWAALVSNIASVPYLHSTQQNQDKPPFVRIDDMSLAQQYQAAGYSVIPPDQACYELFASIRTIILVLNHILDLNLFEGNAGQEALRADFVKHYFPLLCEKLHLQGQYALSPTQKEQVIDVDIIDKERSAPLYSLFETNGIIHQFMTRGGHGEYKFEDTNKNSSDQNIKTMLEAFLTKEAPSIFMVNLIINMYFEDNINFLYSLHPPTFNTIFSLPLSNADCAYKVVENEILRKMNLDLKQPLLLFNLAQSQPDPMRKADLFRMLIPVLTNADTIALIENFALNIGSNPAEALRRKAFSLLSSLVTKSKNREQKERMLFNISHSQLASKDKAEVFIQLAPLLVDVDTKNLMEKFALDIINDPSTNLYGKASDLLETLIKNSQNREQKERIFFNISHSQLASTKNRAEVFTQLAPLLIEIDTTALMEKFALDIINDPSTNLYGKASDLLETLIKNSQNREQKERIFFNISHSQLASTKNRAEVFTQLAPLLIEIDTTALMEKFALDIINDPSTNLYGKASDLLETLIKNSHNKEQKNFERIFNELIKNIPPAANIKDFVSLIYILKSEEGSNYDYDEVKIPQLIENFAIHYLNDNAYQTKNVDSNVIPFLAGLNAYNLINQKILIEYLSAAVKENRLVFSPSLLSLLIKLLSGGLIDFNQKEEINRAALSVLHNFATSVELAFWTNNKRLLSDDLVLINDIFKLTHLFLKDLSDEDTLLIIKKSLDYLRSQKLEDIVRQKMAHGNPLNQIRPLLESIAAKETLSDNLIEQLLDLGEFFLSTENYTYSTEYSLKADFAFLYTLAKKHPSSWLLEQLVNFYKKLIGAGADAVKRKELDYIIEALKLKLAEQPEEKETATPLKVEERQL